MKPFPNYNYEIFPYVLIKDSQSLNVINVRTMQSRVILKDSPYFHDIALTSLMEFQTNPSTHDFMTLYNVEVDHEPNDRRRYFSKIKKYTINLESLDSCFL